MGGKKWGQVVCVASGPSLSISDIDLIRESRLPVVAVNNSWQVIPECDVIFSSDFQWWQEYMSTIQSKAMLWTSSKAAAIRYGLHLHDDQGWLYNSGLRAISLAARFGAKKIILTGYDCSLANGEHWHGKHKNLSNPTKKLTKLWQAQFIRLSETVTDIEIINCSRRTTLTCFPQQEIADALYVKK